MYHSFHFRHLCILCAQFCISSCLIVSVVQAVRGDEIVFNKDVLPILQKHCIDCHGPDQQESGLRLDSMLHSLKGGDSGENVVVPGQSDKSYLVELLLHSDPEKRMPLEEKPLRTKEIQLLKNWIDTKELWKDAEVQLQSETSTHWSFQPLKRPDIPPETQNHPVDAFIARKLQTVGLKHAELADRRTLIRRLYLVMWGLPPTPEEVNQFLADKREDAWERLVDRMLSHHHYGERMATLWLDLIRFGETHGFETNRERPNAWPFRDWVIQSFNQDKPYDQFIRSQIAGDAIGDEIGTGFLVSGPYDVVKGQDPLLRLMQRQDELADMVNTTGTTFLGLSIGCARCHNHKFDPISQTDYYSLQAVFAGVNHADRQIPVSKMNEKGIQELTLQIDSLKQSLKPFLKSPSLRFKVNAKLNEESFPATQTRFVRFTVQQTNSGEPCLDELQIISQGKNVALSSQGAVATSSGDFVHPLHKLEHINDGMFGNSRSWIAKQKVGGWVQIELPKVQEINKILWGRDQQGKYADRIAIAYRIETSLDAKAWKLVASSKDRVPFDSKVKATIEKYDFSTLTAEQAQEQNAKKEQLQKLMRERDSLSTPRAVYAGTFQQPGKTYRLYRGEPDAPREEVTPGTIRSLGLVSMKQQTPEQQRRLKIANWIADARNPLTARVLVNRLWQFHFGTGIVSTPSDFGGNGTPPSHPELLDWLAREFIKQGWSIKALHKIILTSQTWKQSSLPHAQGRTIDAGTRLLWRFPPRRLHAEAIRDSILFVSGSFNPIQGGPGFSGFEVEKENVRHYHPKQNYGPEDWRRMIYMTKVRQERDSVFGLFDCPDGSQVTPVRSRSTTPLQSLNLFNSRFMMQQAERFTQRLNKECDSEEQKIIRAFELCFGRPPEPMELEKSKQFVSQTGWNSLTRTLLNTNEFVFIF